MTEGRGDRVARFRALYDAAYPRLMAYARRRARSPEDAHDVVAETMLTVWRRMADVPEGSAAVPWVFGVARRVLANHYRAEDRRARLLERAVAPPPGADPDFAPVHEALAALRPEQREILTLAAWDDLDNAEIAAVLSLTPAAVAVRMHRARRRLARELGRLGIPGASTQVKSTAPSRTLEGVPGTATGPQEEDHT
jgi:RNA polymerase sigma-70 factor (ECF subfamily)